MTADNVKKPRRKFIQSMTVNILPDGGLVTVAGRMAWALQQLLNAGEEGCTPVFNPAPRWSHYIFMLRKCGLIIETIHEEHGGPYSGTHGRYVLRSSVKVLKESSTEAYSHG